MSFNTRSAMLMAVRNGDLTTVKNLIDKHGLSDGVEGYYFLVEALKYTRNDAAQLLLSCSPRVERNTLFLHSFDYYPIHIAVRNNEEKIIKMWLERRFAINVREEKMNYFAPHQADCNRIQIAEVLLKCGALVDIRTDEDKTPLMIAVESGHIDGVRLLIQNGANVNAVCSKYDGFMPVHFAAMKGYKAILDLLLVKGALADAKSANKSTPLHLAVDFEMEDDVQVDNDALVEEKAASTGTSTTHQLPVAVDCEMEDDMQVMLNSPPDINFVPDGLLYVALALPFRKCRTRMVQSLLKSGARVNEMTVESKTPLHLAVSRGCKDVVQVLLRNGACVNARTAGSKTPLHLAVSGGHKDVVDVLLKSGADVNTEDDDFCSPLLTAVRLYRENLVERNFRWGADIDKVSVEPSSSRKRATENYYMQTVQLRNCGANAPPNDRPTSLLKALVSDNQMKGIVELLLNNGANVNAKLSDSDTVLLLAIRNNHPNLVSLLLERGADVNAEDREGNTSLLLATRNNHPDIVSLLLERGADVNAEDREGNTSLLLATRNNHPDIVSLLLERGADVNAEDRDSNTLLSLALQNKLSLSNVNIIKIILKFRPEINKNSNQNAISTAIRCRPEDLKEEIITALLLYGFPVKSEDVQDYYVVLCVVKNGLVSIVQEFFQHCANSTFVSNITPLHLASFYKQTQIAEILLKYGANVNAQNVAGRTALYYAAANADPNMFGLFLRFGAIVSDTRDLLHVATQSGSLEIVRRLMSRNLDVDVRDEMGRTALHYTNFFTESTLLSPLNNYPLKSSSWRFSFSQSMSVFSNRSSADRETHKSIAEYLLLQGADVNALDNNGNTPLLTAAREGSNGVAEVFLKHGADVNAVDRSGESSLFSSVCKKNFDLIRLLLKAGARTDIKVSDSVTETPLHIATKARDVELVKLLLDSGADVHASCKNGTALHIATKGGDLRLVKLLLDFDADVNAKCTQGTALHIAMEGHDASMVKTLLEYGSDINIVNEENRTSLDCASHSCRAPLIFHLTKMKIANMYLCERNLLSLEMGSLVEYYVGRRDSSFLQELAEISSECEEEIKIMKRTKIGNSCLTYWNFLTKSTREIVRLLANETIVETLSCEKHLIDLDYPIYARMIWNKVKFGKSRREAEEEIKRVFFHDFGLLDVCSDQILRYLTDKDLNMLILAFR